MMTLNKQLKGKTIKSVRQSTTESIDFIMTDGSKYTIGTYCGCIKMIETESKRDKVSD